MEDLDPQHQAVRTAAADLKANRYWSRGSAQQIDYLGDVEDLVREVAFLLTQAGVDWDQITGALHGQQGVVAQLMALDPSGCTEMALCSAVAQARDELAADLESAQTAISQQGDQSL